MLAVWFRGTFITIIYTVGQVQKQAATLIQSLTRKIAEARAQAVFASERSNAEGMKQIPAIKL